jgi:four helix bundle protein
LRPIAPGAAFAPYGVMKNPSKARQRTEALQERALKFSVDVILSYPAEKMTTPAETVWGQLARAADSTSNNLVEADNGSSNADFLNKMRTALREAKESRTCLKKIRLASLPNAAKVIELKLEREADELAAIFATIIMNMERRLAREQAQREARRKQKTGN